MKCLSVRQPWASMIARGEKTIEVRTWSTHYRGPLVICVSKSPRISDLPVGVALVVVDLIDVRPITQDDTVAACCDVSCQFGGGVCCRALTAASTRKCGSAELSAD